MHGRQELVPVAQVILAELPGGVAEWFQQLGDRRHRGWQTDRRAGNTDLGQASAINALAGNEGGASRGATLLTIRIGEEHALLGNAVDVGRPITHQPLGVAAQVGDADIVAPDDEDVRFAIWHRGSFLYAQAMQRRRVTFSLTRATNAQRTDPRTKEHTKKPQTTTQHPPTQAPRNQRPQMTRSMNSSVTNPMRISTAAST